VSASNPHQLLVIMASTGIFMTALAYLFLRNQLRPIRRLAAASEAFGKGRRVPYHPAGASEVRSAGRAFLEMRDRIEGQIEQRTMMLSGVSHDLRTPLTRMRLGLSMLPEEPEVEDLVRDVEEMERLLDTFLDFARGEALDDPAEADPAALARGVVEAARRGGGSVTYEGPETAAPVGMRPMAVQRALTNLVSNALRYGETAVVSVALLDGALSFSVEDDGPGIPPESRGDAVRPFVRLDSARNQDRGSGVGLGLAIADDIARRHGGTLRLGESARLGGLRVDLVLPR
jgi:two-component system osmolarity sensor histidine kinase EnvZ